MPADRKFWFPAKQVGIGWGPPQSWQGWVVLAGYVAGIVLLTVVFPLDGHAAAFALGVAGLTLLLLLACWLKGEPLRWSGGEGG